MSMSYQQKTSRFSPLHQGPSILVLQMPGMCERKVFFRAGFPRLPPPVWRRELPRIPGRREHPLDEMLFMIRESSMP